MARNHHSRNQWPAEREEKFRALWADPALSCAEIGRCLGLSVSAVAGKRNRLKLPTRGSPIHAAGSGVRPHQYQRVRVPAGADTLSKLRSAPQPVCVQASVVAVKRSVPQPAVRGKCQFIAGDTRATWSFCDAPVAKPGSSWCAKHKRVVFTKVRAAEEVG